jgi:DNA-binding transcriptional ArsR family regulator
MMIDSEILDDQGAMNALAKALLGFGHPIRVRCIILLADEHSPSELFELQQRTDEDGYLIEGLSPSLGTVSYHMRMLRDYGLVYETRVAPRRGALEHFYRRTELADDLLRALAPIYGLPRPRRRRKAEVAVAA